MTAYFTTSKFLFALFALLSIAEMATVSATLRGVNANVNNDRTQDVVRTGAADHRSLKTNTGVTTGYMGMGPMTGGMKGMYGMSNMMIMRKWKWKEQTQLTNKIYQKST